MPTYLRGFLPSLGAGGSLVGAALVVAAIVSGLLAFQGWPGAGGSAEGGTVTLTGPRPAPARDARPVSASVRSRTAGAPAAPRRATRRTPARVPAAARGRVVPAAPRGASPAPASGGGSGSTPAARTSPTRSRTPTRVTPPTLPSDPVIPVPVPVPVPEQPAGTVVDEVQQVLPPLAEPVQPVADTVNRVLDDTAATVDGAVDGLLGH